MLTESNREAMTSVTSWPTFEIHALDLYSGHGIVSVPPNRDPLRSQRE